MTETPEPEDDKPTVASPDAGGALGTPNRPLGHSVRIPAPSPDVPAVGQDPAKAPGAGPSSVSSSPIAEKPATAPAAGSPAAQAPPAAASPAQPPPPAVPGAGATAAVKAAPARAAAAHASGKSAPLGAAAKMAKGAESEQAPLAGSADLGWWVLNTTMWLSLIALGAIALLSCARMARALFSIL